MMAEQTRRLLLAAALVFSAAAAGVSLRAAVETKAGGQDVYKELDILCDVITIIRRDYIEPIGAEKLIQDAIRGMLSSLDNYSHLIPPAEPRAPPVEGAAAGELGTYGLEVAYSDRLLTVVAPVEGGPAWKAGIKSGDVIIKINEEEAEERPLMELRPLFRGGAKELRLQVARRGQREFLTFTLKPGPIEGPSARAEMLGDRIGLLRVRRFDRETAALVASCVNGLKAEGVDSLVLDLRDCPGGEIGAAIAAADHFLPAGELVTLLVGRDEASRREYRSKGAPIIRDGPIVVLINGGTSGAAEVLAGALRSGRRGLLMGQKSFGCAFEEGSFPLRDGSVLRMITAAYQTPDGDQIQDEGLDVDVEIPLPAPEPEDEKDEKAVKKTVEKEEKQIDPMVQRAIDLIKGIRIIKPQGGS